MAPLPVVELEYQIGVLPSHIVRASNQMTVYVGEQKWGGWMECSSEVTEQGFARPLGFVPAAQGLVAAKEEHKMEGVQALAVALPAAGPQDFLVGDAQTVRSDVAVASLQAPA